ncbi:hypothetical protein [Streptomonospora halophila]|uniref:hypothetical protein n=1 Tax=Streptomonospora halophila TaxID=427369 RepID=UPI0031EE8654
MPASSPGSEASPVAAVKLSPQVGAPPASPQPTDRPVGVRTAGALPLDHTV